MKKGLLPLTIIYVNVKIIRVYCLALPPRIVMTKEAAITVAFVVAVILSVISLLYIIEYLSASILGENNVLS